MVKVQRSTHDHLLYIDLLLPLAISSDTSTASTWFKNHEKHEKMCNFAQIFRGLRPQTPTGAPPLDPAVGPRPHTILFSYLYRSQVL